MICRSWSSSLSSPKLMPKLVALVALSSLIAQASADYSQDHAFLQWLQGEQGAPAGVSAIMPPSNFDPQALSRLYRRSDPSIRLLKRSQEEFEPNFVDDDEEDVDGSEEKRSGMVRLVRAERPRRSKMVRLLRSGMVRLMKKKRGGMVRLM